MDLINKLKVLMKISSVESEAISDSYNGTGKGLRLSPHYLAQCLHRQCDMYELREMCRLQRVEVKRGAGKRQIIESLIDHLPNDDSPKEVCNKTRHKMKTSTSSGGGGDGGGSSAPPSPSRQLNDENDKGQHRILNLKRVASK